jgi:hypothetical protein
MKAKAGAGVLALTLTVARWGTAGVVVLVLVAVTAWAVFAYFWPLAKCRKDHKHTGRCSGGQSWRVGSRMVHKLARAVRNQRGDQDAA